MRCRERSQGFLWEQHPDALLRAAIETHRGQIVKKVGDQFCAAFATVGDALDMYSVLEETEDRQKQGGLYENDSAHDDGRKSRVL